MKSGIEQLRGLVEEMSAAEVAEKAQLSKSSLYYILNHGKPAGKKGQGKSLSRLRHPGRILGYGTCRPGVRPLRTSGFEKLGGASTEARRLPGLYAL